MFIFTTKQSLIYTWIKIWSTNCSLVRFNIQLTLHIIRVIHSHSISLKFSHFFLKKSCVAVWQKKTDEKFATFWQTQSTSLNNVH